MEGSSTFSGKTVLERQVNECLSIPISAKPLFPSLSCPVCSKPHKFLEYKVDGSKAEETNVEQSKAEESKVEETKTQETNVESGEPPSVYEADAKSMVPVEVDPEVWSSVYTQLRTDVVYIHEAAHGSRHAGYMKIINVF